MGEARPPWLVGRHVVDRNGRTVGSVELVFADDAGRPEWMGVVTSGLRRQRVLVPAGGVENGSGTLRVPWTRHRLRRAPRYDASDQVGALGLGQYRIAISTAKAREALAFYGSAGHG